MLARQLQSDESNKKVITQISTVSRGAYPFSIVSLAIALVALAVAITTFVSLGPMLKLYWAAMKADLFCTPLRYAYTDCIEEPAYQVKVVSVLKRKHKCVEYRARQTRNQTLEKLETQVTLILHINGMARLDYCPLQII